MKSCTEDARVMDCDILLQSE